MTEAEKIELIKAGISHRHEHYLQVKQLPDLPLKHISNRTGFSVHFVKQCREIAGKNKLHGRN